jgi:hypothetical protein
MSSSHTLFAVSRETMSATEEGKGRLAYARRGAGEKKEKEGVGI